GGADPRRRERARDRGRAAAAQRARGPDRRRVLEARRAPARTRRAAPGRRAGPQAARRLGRQARQRHRDRPGGAALPGPDARRPAAPGAGREEGPRRGAPRRLRHAHVRRQPAARGGAAQRRPLPERHRLARRPGGAGRDPQPHRARLARRADQRAGGAGLLPLRVHHPAVHDRDRHCRVVAPEVPVIRRILILLVLVAALGTYLYVYELPEAAREGKKEKLVGIDKDAVTGVVLTYPDRELELKRDDTGWRLVRPAEAPADDTVVKGVLSTVADAEVQKTLGELPQNLADFGLDKPTVTIKLTLKDGSQPPPLVVGKNTAIGGKAYVRK